MRQPPPPILHPAALAAVALLLVNDHVLKAAWPGPRSGSTPRATNDVAR